MAWLFGFSSNRLPWKTTYFQPHLTSLWFTLSVKCVIRSVGLDSLLKMSLTIFLSQLWKCHAGKSELKLHRNENITILCFLLIFFNPMPVFVCSFTIWTALTTFPSAVQGETEQRCETIVWTTQDSLLAFKCHLNRLHFVAELVIRNLCSHFPDNPLRSNAGDCFLCKQWAFGTFENSASDSSQE